MIHLPIEIVQKILFGYRLSARSVFHFAVTCRRAHHLALGTIGAPNEYDVAQHRALTGLVYCCKKKWGKAAWISFVRDIRVPERIGFCLMSFFFNQNMPKQAIKVPRYFYDPIEAAPMCLEHGYIEIFHTLRRQADYIIDQTSYGKEDFIHNCARAAAASNNNDIFFELIDFYKRGFFLSIAVAKGNVELVTRVLSHPTLEDDDDVDHAVFVVVHTRSQTQKIEILRLLINHKTFSGFRRNWIYSHPLINNKEFDVVDFLFENGLEVVGELENAMRHKKMACVRFLLKHKRLSRADKENMTKQVLVSSDAIFLLFYEDKTLSIDWATLLVDFAGQGKLMVVRTILNDRPVLTKDVASLLLIWACLYGWFEVVQVLVAAYGLDPSVYKNSAVAIAAELNHRHILLYLLDDSRVDHTAFDHSVVCWSAYWGDVELIERLVPNALSLMYKNDPPLFSLCLAAEFGNLRLIHKQTYPLSRHCQEFKDIVKGVARKGKMHDKVDIISNMLKKRTKLDFPDKDLCSIIAWNDGCPVA